MTYSVSLVENYARFTDNVTIYAAEIMALKWLDNQIIIFSDSLSSSKTLLNSESGNETTWK